jgi:AraC family transcriptional regulator, regulatory protein of adaptative response / methylated-DNA-[protein]-cysteine methyltransferase
LLGASTISMQTAKNVFLWAPDDGNDLDPVDQLDDAGVEALAERLGIGARHLLRLFKKHVGASPTQVAQTARVQRAKRMIDNTYLPMTAIALAAGFGSLRRFNTVFAAVYKCPPTALRRTSHAPMASAA